MNNVIDAPPQVAAQQPAPLADNEVGPDETAPDDEPGYSVDAAGTFKG